MSPTLHSASLIIEKENGKLSKVYSPLESSPFWTLSPLAAFLLAQIDEPTTCRGLCAGRENL